MIAISGLVLWAGRQGRRPRTAREFLLPLPRGKGEQLRMRAVHGPLGLWLTAGLLVMSVTGLAMSPFAGRLLADFRSPTLSAVTDGVPGDAPPIGVDRALEIARANGPTVSWN
ncbi:hypothetical protein BJF78_32040 [Pseudonocardia sp. CNS-139]|nr:hypothetical protein BJF78_32040 [Pseudonocardia sp. CNS-139]